MRRTPHADRLIDWFTLFTPGARGRRKSGLHFAPERLRKQRKGAPSFCTAASASKLSRNRMKRKVNIA
jgi:hypothetical protein